VWAQVLIMGYFGSAAVASVFLQAGWHCQGCGQGSLAAACVHAGIAKRIKFLNNLVVLYNLEKQIAWICAFGYGFGRGYMLS